MSLYRRNRTWWYEFVFHGSRIRESANTSNKDAARQQQAARLTELTNAVSIVPTKRPKPQMFTPAAEAYLKAKAPDWAPKTAVIEKTNVAHLRKAFGGSLLSDITAGDVAAYRADRIESDAAAKTVSLELGTLRAMLRYYDLDATWKAIGKKVKLAKGEDIGKAITLAEETRLLSACRLSRSRSLYVAVATAIQSGMRYSELRLLHWHAVDFARRVIVVGDSKTEYGRNREIPLTRLLLETLRVWAAAFPTRKPDHFVFCSEKYGQPKKGEPAAVYAVDPSKPITTWKYAWREARRRSKVSCRFHDLRHTAATRMVEAGIPLPVVAEIMGWSPSTAIRMSKVYAHVASAARRSAIEQMERYVATQASATSDEGHSTEADVSIQ